MWCEINVIILDIIVGIPIIWLAILAMNNYSGYNKR